MVNAMQADLCGLSRPEVLNVSKQSVIVSQAGVCNGKRILKTWRISMWPSRAAACKKCRESIRMQAAAHDVNLVLEICAM